MALESRLEKYVKDFVWSKISEAVYLRLEDEIAVRPIDKRGSASMASLWTRILQHEANFPPIRFRYRSESTAGQRLLVLRTEEEVRLAVNMTSGALRIGGRFVYDWFTQRFKAVIDNFDPEFQRVWTFVATDPGRLPSDDASSAARDEHEKPETEAYLLLENRGRWLNSDFEHKIEEHNRQHVVDNIGNMSLARSIWSMDEVNQQLASLDCGGNCDTSAYIYPLWRSLLHHWFQKQNAVIYMSSPMLDAERLCYIVAVVLDPGSTAALKCLYVQFQSDPVSKVNAAQLQKEALARFDQRQQLGVESKVFRCMTYPLGSLLSSFAAVVEGNSATVFATSACYHSVDFDNSRMAFAVCTRLSTDRFVRRFLQPLESSQFVSSLSQ